MLKGYVDDWLVVCIIAFGSKSASMFVSGFNVNLPVVVTIQLQLYRGSCDRASNDLLENYTGQVYKQGLDKESNATRQKQYYFDQVVLF